MSDLDDHLQRITVRYERAQRYAASDPEVALAEARKTAEAIARALYVDFQRENPEHKSFRKQASGLMLGMLASSLEAAKRTPLIVATSLRTIQAFGNIGAHDQGKETDLVDQDTVQSCLSALETVYKWYMADQGVTVSTKPAATPTASSPVPDSPKWKKVGVAVLGGVSILGTALGLYNDGKEALDIGVESAGVEAEESVDPMIVALGGALTSLRAPELPEACVPEEPATLELAVQTAEYLRDGHPGSNRPQDRRALDDLLQRTREEGHSTVDWALLALAHQQVEGASTASAQAAAVSARACTTWAYPPNLEGNAHLKLGNLPEARVAYQAALAMEPNYAAPRFNLALTWLKGTDDVDASAAENELTRLLASHPHHPNAHLIRAQARVMQQNIEGAIEDARAAIEANDSDGGAHALLGNLLKATGDDAAATKSLCRAKALGNAALQQLDCAVAEGG